MNSTSKMLVTAATMSMMVANGWSTKGVGVTEYSPRLLTRNRFANVDLKNNAKQPVKSSYNAKQRKRKKALKEQWL